MTQPVGHLDFYPNGGQSMPGCDELSFSLGNIDDMFDGNSEAHTKLSVPHQISF